MRVEDKIALIASRRVQGLDVFDAGKLRRHERRQGDFKCADSGVLFEAQSRIYSPWIVRSFGSSPDGEAETAFIGAYSYINDGGCIRDHVLIGRFCSIGRRVSIGAGHHSLTQLSTSPALSRPEYVSDKDLSHRRTAGFSVIGSDCWIGDGVVVLNGVSIGPGAVVGANSVVTRDMPPYSVAAGAPARVLRLRFDEETISRLLALQWWNYPYRIIRESVDYSPMLGDQISFLEDRIRTNPELSCYVTLRNTEKDHGFLRRFNDYAKRFFAKPSDCIRRS